VTHIHLRILGPDDATLFQRLRLQGLLDVPEAFGTTYEEDRVLPEEVVAERLRPVRAPVGRAVVGAFMGEALVGFAGCMQSPKRKTRHKAEIWGTYVTPDARGRGVGRQLLEALIAEARAWEGVERLTLSVVERAGAAWRLYTALGFEEFGREPDAFRQGVERDVALHLTRLLHPETGYDAPAAQRGAATDGRLPEGSGGTLRSSSSRESASSSQLICRPQLSWGVRPHIGDIREYTFAVLRDRIVDVGGTSRWRAVVRVVVACPCCRCRPRQRT
jgi:GNAT superfamily N-acetyltransferase